MWLHENMIFVYKIVFRTDESVHFLNSIFIAYSNRVVLLDSLKIQIVYNPLQKFRDCIDFLPFPPTKQCCGCDGRTFWSENDHLETTLLCRGRGINIIAFRKEQICFHKNEQKIRPLGVGLNIFCEGL